MDLNFQNQIFILAGLILAASAVAAFLIFDLKKKVKKLYGGRGDADLEKNLVGRIARTEAKLEEIEPRLKLVEEVAKISVQRVGFLRFNPFPDTGGDHSFVLVMLDRGNNGIIINSLYLREGMRLYAKKVDNGKSKQPLSEEEKKVLEETLNQSKT
ncbi:MAG TPA: DUF4446 family protein [Candidatus Paceibacterota bacterium]